jgi:prepilin-type processing-associated H-X9-DG protein
VGNATTLSRYIDGANVVYLDGHCRWRRAGELTMNYRQTRNTGPWGRNENWW